MIGERKEKRKKSCHSKVKMLQYTLYPGAEPKGLGTGPQSEAETLTCQHHKLTYKPKCEELCRGLVNVEVISL